MNSNRKIKRLDADIKKWMMKDLTPSQQVICIIAVIISQVYIFSR